MRPHLNLAELEAVCNFPACMDRFHRHRGDCRGLYAVPGVCPTADVDAGSVGRYVLSACILKPRAAEFAEIHVHRSHYLPTDRVV